MINFDPAREKLWEELIQRGESRALNLDEKVMTRIVTKHSPLGMRSKQGILLFYVIDAMAIVGLLK